MLNMQAHHHASCSQFLSKRLLPSCSRLSSLITHWWSLKLAVMWTCKMRIPLNDMWKALNVWNGTQNDLKCDVLVITYPMRSCYCDLLVLAWDQFGIPSMVTHKLEALGPNLHSFLPLRCMEGSLGRGSRSFSCLFNYSVSLHAKWMEAFSSSKIPLPLVQRCFSTGKNTITHCGFVSVFFLAFLFSSRGVQSKRWTHAKKVDQACSTDQQCAFADF